MQVNQLDHVNIKTAQLGGLINWYSEILGLKKGPRPDFPFDGAWMYAGKTAIVHLVAVDNDQAVGSESALKLEHFALSATDLQSFEARLQKNGIKYERDDNLIVGLVQVNIWDPDGNHIHVDFPLNERER